jgi:hypothetical protein
MLGRLGFGAALVERVCYLVGHHHTYTNIDGPDYQILVEAGFPRQSLRGRQRQGDLRDGAAQHLSHCQRHGHLQDHVPVAQQAA